MVVYMDTAELIMKYEINVLPNTNKKKKVWAATFNWKFSTKTAKVSLETIANLKTTTDRANELKFCPVG